MVTSRFRSLLAVAWVLPCSVLGGLFAAFVLLFGGRLKVVGGVIEVALTRGPRSACRFASHLPFSAITFGHVVLGASEAELHSLREHERVHVRQYEQWGVLFLLVYPGASLVSFLRGRGWYQGNVFEVQARACGSSEGFARLS